MLSAVSALVALVLFVYIWKILRDVLNAAPNYAQAVNIFHYGWMAVLFAVLPYLIYIAALMCSHLSAFRVATNLRLAARFWDYQKGSITVGGMDVSRIDPEKLMSLYSIVFQDVTLFDNTILENIRLGRKGATDEEVLAAAKLANCEEFAEKLTDAEYQN